jgi:hypothetical protein
VATLSEGFRQIKARGRNDLALQHDCEHMGCARIRQQPLQPLSQWRAATAKGADRVGVRNTWCGRPAYSDYATMFWIVAQGSGLD